MHKGTPIDLPWIRSTYLEPGSVKQAVRYDGKVYVPHSVYVMDGSSLTSLEEDIARAREEMDVEIEEPSLNFSLDESYGGTSIDVSIEGWREATDDEMTYINRAEAEKKQEKKEREKHAIREAQELLREKGLL